MANLLYHGTTLHGEQRVDPTCGATVEPGTPLADFHRDGPLGDVFAAVDSRFDHVGTLGLGAGWEVEEVPPGLRPWTEDYSNIVGGLDW